MEIEKCKKCLIDAHKDFEELLFQLCTEEEFGKMVESDPILRDMCRELHEKEYAFQLELTSVIKESSELKEEEKVLNEKIDKYPRKWERECYVIMRKDE